MEEEKVNKLRVNFTILTPLSVEDFEYGIRMQVMDVGEEIISSKVKKIGELKGEEKRKFVEKNKDLW